MRKTLLLLILFTYQSLLLAQASDWTLISSESDIEVSTRYTESNPIKQVRILATIDAPSSDILASLHDVESYTSWVYKCKRSYKVDEFQNGDFLYYTETEMPGFFSNRDLVVHSSQYEADGIIYSISQSKPEMLDPVADNVRITDFNSEWRLIPVDSLSTKVEYFVNINPGGYLPPWLVNLGISSGPLRSIRNLKHILEN